MSTEKPPEHGYALAYRLAQEQVGKIADLESQCRNSGARCIDAHKVTIDYLKQSYVITLPVVDVVSAEGNWPVPLRDRILILHYFARARGTPLSNSPITYKELPEGANYFPVFYKRAIKPLVDHFGGSPQRMLAVAEDLMGGRKANYGDAAVAIDAFSKAPVTLVLWQGDAEFPAEGNIMFDSTVSDYLSTEDVNVLCETIAWRLVKAVDVPGATPKGPNLR